MKPISIFTTNNNWRRFSKLSFLISLVFLLSLKGIAQTADFSADITSVCVGNNVTFTDNSSGTSGTVYYSWNFGTDASLGTTTTVGPHIVSYSSSGLKTVTLTITDDNDSYTETKTNYIDVSANNTVGAASSSPTLCINTALAPITHTTTGAVGIGAATGLPAGVTAAWSSNTITISGTPTASGTFNYTIPLNGGCGTVSATGTIIVNPNNTVGAASSSPTLCINTALAPITHSTTGAVGIGTATGLPAGVTAAWSSNTITISGTPTGSGTFNYSIPLTGGCGVVNATGTITVNPNNTVGAASSSPTLCINTALAPITHSTTGAVGIGTATGLPAGVTAAWSSNTITISGTPTGSGTFNYSIPLTGGCGVVNATGTITVNPNNTVGAASSSPTLCINTALAPITHSTTGAVGIGTATGLPAGVTAAWSSNTITISGTPTGSGTFNYSIPLTGGCGVVNATGTITVNPNNTVGAASSSPTLCINTALAPITHSTTGAVGIGTATGLPAGVTAAWSSNTITISGTPTGSGTFNYSISLTGGCGVVNATGTITVNPNNTVGAASSNPTLCINTALAPITHSTTGAVGIGTATGLPAGVTAAWSSNTITISGTPTGSGTFNYSIPLTGGCGVVNATGTITVNPNNTVGAASSNPTLCINTALAPITHSTTGAVGIGTATGLPAGVTAAWSSNTITISGTPTGSGTFNYSIPLTGGCGVVNATGTIIVTPDATITHTSGSTNQTICIDTPLAPITYTVGASGNGGTVTDLPLGVTGTYSGGVITISGTPTESGTFNYTATANGPCVEPSLGGTITVTPDATITHTSGSTNQTICIDTPLAPITYTVGASGNGGTVTDLPLGVTGTYSGGVITISGTPTESGTFNYTATANGPCVEPSLGGSITVTPDATITHTSGSTSQTICINTPLAPITYTVGASGNGGTVTDLPLGVTGTYSGGVITISGTPTESGTFNYTATANGPCVEPSLGGSITVTPNATITHTSGSTSQTICINTPLAPITYTVGASGNGGIVTDLPLGVTGTYSGGVITISGTPTESGTFNYTATANGPCVEPSLGGSITVTPDATITHTSGSTNQTICIDTPLAPITYTVGASGNGGTVTDLPLGVTGTYSGGVITISGTPTESGTFNYTATANGPCVEPSLGGSITVTPNATITHTSGSTSQTICINTPLAPITYTVGASGNGGTVTDLPLGVTGTYSGGVITISGTPTESGTFNYTATANGPCVEPSLGGSITVTPNATITHTSGSTSQTICINTPLAPITYTVGVSGNGGTVTDLPLGVTGTYSGGVITISGTPTESGTFNYTATANGPCVEPSLGGSITVTPNATITHTSGSTSQTICINTPLAPITYTVGASGNGGTVTDLPLGVTGTYSGGVITISGTPTESGTFNYTATANGPCVEPSLGGTITVEADATISLSSGAGTDNQTLCINNPLSNITYLIGGGGTGASVSGLPGGVSGVFSGNTMTISGTPNVAGSFNYIVSTEGPCVIPTISGSINVTEDATIALSSANANQTICINTTLENITFDIGGSGSDGTVSGLPDGLNGSYSAGVFTISGTATESGSFNYIVRAIGPCVQPITGGTIDVTPDATISLNSGIGTDNQTVCIHNPISGISYLIGESGNDGTVSGLPNGVNGTYSGGVFSINGTPTESGTFDYTVTAIGPCVMPSAVGTIVVTPDATISLTSANSVQTICINNPLQDITYSIGGSGNNGSVSGLPDGVSGSYSGGLLTISGTPEESGSFIYTATAYGPCVEPAAVGTINVTPDATIALTSANSLQTVCINTEIEDITYLVGGSGNDGTVIDLPDGLSGTYSGGVITISGTPTEAGTFNYTATANGPCVEPDLGGTITVTPDATIALSSGNNNQTICIYSALDEISFTIGGSGSGATVVGLPEGVNGTYSSNIFTISGTPSVSGIYNYTVTALGPCVEPISSGTITVIALPVTTALNNGPVCLGTELSLYGGPDAMSTYNWSGPNGYTSVLQNPNVASSATASMAGIYTLVTTNSYGCENSATTNVIVNPLPSPTASDNSPICEGAVLSLTGGQNGMSSYLWTGPDAYTSSLQSPIVSNSASLAMEGEYTLTVVNSNGCVNSVSTNVSINPLPTATIGGSTIVCKDDPFPGVTFTGADGTAAYTFTYRINGGADQYVMSSVGSSVTVPVPTGNPGVYTYSLVSVRDQSSTACENPQSGSATITINPLPTASIGGSTTICQFETYPNITFSGASGTAPYTFIYTINSGDPQIISTSGINTNVSIPVETEIAGIFTYSLVSVQDASTTSCSQNQGGSATVTINHLPTATISGSDEVCQDSPAPNITFTGAEGQAPYTFTYTINSGGLRTVTSTGTTANVAVPTSSPGTFQYNLVSVQDASSTRCEQIQTGSATITINPLPTATVSGNAAVCQFDTEPEILFEGANGTAPYTFTYTVNSGSNQIIVSASGSSVSIPVPTETPGTFTYTLRSVRDDSGTACWQAQGGSATVVVNPLPEASIAGSAEVCQNGPSPQILFSGSGGTAPYTFTYSINSGADFTITTSSGSTVNLPALTTTAGTFIYDLISVQDASSSTCIQAQTGSVTILVNPLPTATITGTTSVCRNDVEPQLTFTGSGGTAPYIFRYTINGAGPYAVSTLSGNSVTVNAPTLAAGILDYELISVQDASSTNCINTQSGNAFITVNELPLTSIISGELTPACNAIGEVYSVSLTSGSSYTWVVPDGANITSGINGSENNSITVDFGAFNGNISVIETNANGCSGEQVDLPISLLGCDLDANFSASSTSVCDGSSIIFTDVSTGTSGDTSYEWDFGTGASPAAAYTIGPHTVSYSGTGTRTVSLTITEGDDDNETKANYITVNPLPTATIGGSTDVCEDSAFPDIVFTGGNGTAPYTFTYSIDGGDPLTVTSISENIATVPVPTGTPGTYIYTLESVRDASTSSCSQSQFGTATVNVNPLPTAIIEGSTEVCNNADSPDITFTGSDGTAPYTFEYSLNGGASQFLVSNAGGVATLGVPTSTVGSFTYELLSVQDNSTTTCLNAQSGEAEVIVNPLPTASISGALTVCRDDIEPNITFSGDFGTAPYTFTYTINSGLPRFVTTIVGRSVTVAAPTDIDGDYVYELVSVQDASFSACTQSASGQATITVNPLPVATIEGTTEVCKDDTSPLITFNGAGGTAPYTFTYNINGGTAYSVTTSSGNSVSIPVPTGVAGFFSYNLISVRDASATACVQAQSGSAEVTINTVPSAIISGNAAVCQNSVYPEVTFTGANGTEPYTFAFTINSGEEQYVTTDGSNQVTVAVPTELSGIFTYALVGVEDASSTRCSQSQTGSVTIVINPLPTATIEGTTTVCRDASFPNITFTGNNGTAPYIFTYTIDNGAYQTVTSSLSGTANVPVPTGTTGEFNYELISVQDASTTNCVQFVSGSATVTINPLPRAEISGNAIVCQFGDSPEITFRGLNGIAPYTFIYTVNSGSNQIVSTTGGLDTVTVPVNTSSTGTYTYSLVSVEDGSITTCSQTQAGSASVIVNPLPTATIGGTANVCQGSPSPNVTFTGFSFSGFEPYTFTYRINGGDPLQVTTSFGTSVNVPAPTSTAGVYLYELLSVRDASLTTCEQTMSGSAVITVNPLPTATIEGTTEVCQFGSSPDITFTGYGGTAPYTFIYRINNGAYQSISSAIGSIVNVPVSTNLTGTFVYELISVQDGSSTSCEQSQGGTATVSVNTLPQAAISGSGVVCQNSAEPVITFTGSNGTAPYTFNYTINNGGQLSVSTISGNSVSVNAPTSAAGSFEYELISVQDNSFSHCIQSQSGSALITVNPLPTATISGTTSVCRSGASPQITFTGSGGTAPYIFTYSINGNTPLTVPSSGNTVTVDVPTDIAGIYNYELISVEDASSTHCQQTQGGNAIITVNELPATSSISGNSEPACFATGEVYSVTLNSGSVYTWIVPDGAIVTSGLTGQENNSISVNFGSNNGNVSVIETNTNGCSGPRVDFPVSLQGCALDANFSADYTSVCSGSSIVFTDISTGTSGSTFYSWSFGAGAIPSTASGPGPHTITYTEIGLSTVGLTITDGNTNTETKINYIRVNPLPSASISGGIDVCENDPFPLITFTGSNGTAPYIFTYSIDGEAPQTVSSLAGNTASVSVPTGVPGTVLYELISVQDNSSSACLEPASGSAEVTINPLPQATISGNADVCRGGIPPEITFTGSNGTAPYTFTYTINGETPLSVESTVGSTVSIQVPTGTVGPFLYELLSVSDNSTSSCEQSVSGSAEVVINPLPTATIDGTIIVCRDDISPMVRFTGAGGTAPYLFTYTVNSGEPQTALTMIGSSVDVAAPTDNDGVFTYALISVSDAGGTGCTQGQTGSATVTVNPLPTATIDGDNAVCRDAATPYITFTGFDGEAPYTFTYTINGGNPLAVSTTVGSTISIPVATGTVGPFEYRLVSVQDFSTTTCSQNQTGTATVIVNPLPIASIGGTATVCRYGTPPEVIFTGSNGTAPYTFTYSINSGAPQTITTSSGNSVSLFAPTDNIGIYTYSLESVQDASSTACVRSQTGGITVTVEELPTASIGGTSEVCQFASFPLITFTGANGTAPFTFTYTINGESPQSITTESGNTASIPVSTGTAGTFDYELVSVRDAGSNPCEQSQSGLASVTVNPLPSATISGSASVCRYDSEPLVTFTGSNGTAPYIFTYTINSGEELQVASAGGSSVSVSAPTDQTGLLSYSLISVEDGSSTSCAQSVSGIVDILVNPLPTATISGNDEVCQGDPSPEVIFTGSSGTAPFIFTYTLNGGANLTAVSSGNIARVPHITTSSGSYVYELLSVSDASSSLCEQSQTGSATVVVNPLPSATISGTNSVCLNSTPPQVTFTGSGGTFPYTFIYTINGGTPQAIVSTTGNVVTLDAPTNISGVYSYALISVQDESSTECFNPQTGNAVITVYDLPETSVISGDQTPACGAVGESYSVSLSPGSSYTWTVPDGAFIVSGATGSENNTIVVNFGSTNGNISVIETNANGCIGSRVDLVISLQGCALNANFSASNTSVCDGSSITFTDISTGTSTSTTYSWNFGTGSSPSIASGAGPHLVSYSGTGTRSVSLTIVDGATNTENKINYITVNPLPTASISGSGEVCRGGISPLITFTGDDGTAPYLFRYRVNGGLPLTVSSLVGDVATVAVPTGTAGTIVYELLSVQDASSTACLQAQGGTASVVVHALPTATITGTSTEVCRDGASPEITFTGFGGSAPYTFVYTINDGAPQLIASTSGSSVTIQVPTGIVGSYTYELVSVQDNNTGCSQAQSGSLKIAVNPLPTATIKGTTIVCRYELYPKVTFTGDGGTPPYTFTYTVNSGDPLTVTTLFGDEVTVNVPTEIPGSFTYSLVSVMDNNVNRCEQAQSGSATVTVNPLPAALISGTTTVCKDDSPPEVVFIGFSGIEPYTFTYRLNGGSLQTVVSSSGGSAAIQVPTGAAGTFDYELVSVRDASVATCEQPQSGMATITVNPLPEAIISGTRIVCRNDVEPEVTFTGSNGTAPYTFTYTINSGPAEEITTSGGSSVSIPVSTNATGTFTYALIRVEDASSTTCSQTQTGSVSITVNPLPLATIEGTIEICQDDILPEITFTGSGGTAPYTFYYSVNGGSIQATVSDAGSEATVSVPTETAGVFTYELLSVSDASPSICDQVQGGTAIVTINPLPEALIEGDASVCRLAVSPIVTFRGSNGTAPYIFTYTINDGPLQAISSISGDNAYIPAPTDISGPFVYELLSVQDASNTTCLQAQGGSITINVIDLPLATISGSTTVCRDDASPIITFTGSNGLAPYTFTYTINGGNTQTVTTSIGNSVSIEVPTGTAGIYTYELQSVQDGAATACSQAQSGSAIINIDEIPVANAGSGGQACEYEFQLNAIPDIGSGMWAMTSGTGSATFFPDANAPDAIVTVSELGLKEFSWTEVNGSCSNFASIEVIFFEMPDANPGFGSNECDLDYTLNAVPGLGTGVWSMTAGSGSASFYPGADDPNALVEVTDEGVKEFTWTVTNGVCVDAESINVSFYHQPTAVAGLGGNSCGLSFNLDAIPSYGTGSWTITGEPGSGSFSPNAFSADAEVTVDAFGTYELTWTEINGTCSDMESINVTFYEVPSANAGAGGEECDLDFIFSAVPGTGTGTWTLLSGPGNATFTPDIYQSDAHVSVDQYGAYQFQWTEVNAICESDDIIDVIFRSLPNVFAGNDTIICLGDDVQLEAIGEGSFSWDPAGTLDNAGIYNPIATPDELTEYTVILTDQYGCVNSDTVIVEPWTQPIAFAGEDLTLEYLFTAWTEAELDLHQSGFWEMTQGNGSFANDTLGVTFISGLSLGENILKWTVTNGVCPATIDYMTITVNDLVIPTLITPNLDGRNDFFVLRGIETLGETELIIFDRRGARVYRNTNYDNSWDGTDQGGNPLPEDTYFFSIKPTNGEAYSGYIVIRR